MPAGVSTTPTISVRNIPIALTGAPVAGVGGTGPPNFHFVERPSDRAYYFYGSDADGHLRIPLRRAAPTGDDGWGYAPLASERFEH